MNKKLLGIFISTLIVVLPSALVLAGHSKCSDKTGDHQWDIESKFFKKAHLMMEKQEELGLSDEQAEKIKNLKISTEKYLIKKNAEIEILALDIKKELWKDAVDANVINKLIDQKYDNKKEKTKALVDAYASLKGTLTAEQLAKLKEIYKECHKKDGSCPRVEKEEQTIKP